MLYRRQKNPQERIHPGPDLDHHELPGFCPARDLCRSQAHHPGIRSDSSVEGYFCILLEHEPSIPYNPFLWEKKSVAV